MPRPNMPPTPGSSSDLRGREADLASSKDTTFKLPPTAYSESQVDRASNTPSGSSVNGASSDSSYHPGSPRSPDPSRKRPGAQPTPRVVTKDDFSLPPPPTRSRKIIQMKPRESVVNQLDAQTAASSAAAQTSGQAQAQGTGSGKRKSNNAPNTTAGGRKIARKTAHSLIERRRRSKMNEEFGVLKDMIPACNGQEMHKLAILQASIEYLRYLEQCITDLKQQAQHNPSPSQPSFQVTPQMPDDALNDEDDDGEDDNEDEDGDQDMLDDPQEHSHTGHSTPAAPSRLGLESSRSQSNSLISLPSLSQITTTLTTSPSIFSTHAGDVGRHYSISSTSQASYSPYFHSNQTSPAFGPQLHLGPGSNFGGIGSPALKPIDSVNQQLQQIAERATAGFKSPQGPRGETLAGSGQPRPKSQSEHDMMLDHEATAALLMLNHDRRGWRPADNSAGRSSNPGGMSVRDLLSG